MSKLEQVLRIIRSPNIGPITYYFLQQKFNHDLHRINDFLLNHHSHKLISMEVVRKEIQLTLEQGADFLLTEEIFNNPHLTPVIICKGNKNLLKKPMVAVVGTRNASIIGTKFCRNLTVGLTERGCVVVSGLAVGIDTTAHITALNSGTIAVLPGDITTSYPSHNDPLYSSIGEQGLLVTAQPLGSSIGVHSFPMRNTLIASLSNICVVVEAGLKSGAIDTANKFLKQGKTVYAIPGHPFEDRYCGSNNLIKRGAKILTSIDDIDLYGICAFKDLLLHINDEYCNKQFKYILNSMKEEVHIDTIIDAINMPYAQALYIIGKFIMED